MISLPPARPSSSPASSRPARIPSPTPPRISPANAFDPKGGDLKWKYRDRSFPYFSSAAVTADRVIIGGRDKRLHCIDRASGKGVWTFQTRGEVESSPVVCGDAIIVGSGDGRLYCVGLADGKERWAYEIGAAVTASPAVADGRIVIGAEDGSVYCFGAK